MIEQLDPTASDEELTTEDIAQTLEDVRAFLDDPVALLERALKLVRPRGVDTLVAPPIPIA